MAAISAAYGFRIKPARFDDWCALAREGDKIIHRLGGHNLRTFATVAAGPETNMCFSTIEFVDGAHMGTFFDATARDLEGRMLNDRMFGHVDSPAELLHVALLTEIGVETNATGTGPVMDVWVSRIRPGRYTDALAFVNETSPVAERSGATGIRLYSVGAAGSESGRMAWAAEYESFEAYGRSLDLLDSPESQELMGRLYSADAPFEIMQHTVFSEIPLH